MRMQRVRSGREVLQVDNDHVTHFCPQDGTEEAQPGGLGDLHGVAPICVVSINRLLVNAAYPVGPSFEKQGCKSGSEKANVSLAAQREPAICP